MKKDFGDELALSHWWPLDQRFLAESLLSVNQVNLADEI